MKFNNKLAIVLCLGGGVLWAEEFVENPSDAIAKAVEKELANQGVVVETAQNDAVFVDSEIDRTQLKEEISKVVSKELNGQMERKLRSHEKENVYTASKDDPLSDKKVSYIYKVPAWPRQARFFMKKDQLALDMAFDFATQCYGSHGGTKDVSKLIFQEDAIHVKDILLASQLIDLGMGNPSAAYAFLRTLKDKVLNFDASTNRQLFALSYARHFRRGDISLGFQVPFIRRENKVKMTSTLTPAENNSLNANFFTLYPNGLIDFFTDILRRKNISYNERDSEVGVGDVHVFMNYDIPNHFSDHFLVGFDLLLPTAKRRDTYKLWDPELGNGGFVELAAFASILFHQSRWLNPHVFLQGNYAIRSDVFRRVPEWCNNTGLTAGAKFGDDYMIFGNNVIYAGGTFDQLDATVRGFADNARKIQIHPGPHMNLRLGNVIENVFSERNFFDLFYELYAKGRDYLGFRQAGDPFDGSVLNYNSSEVSHRIGFDFSRHIDDMWRVNIGFLYAFAGYNSLRTIQLNCAINLEF